MYIKCTVPTCLGCAWWSPQAGAPSAYSSLQNSSGNPSFGNGNNPVRPEGRVGTSDVLLGIDSGVRCHFSNLTPGEIKRWRAVNWCDSAAVAVHSAATAALRPRGKTPGWARRGRTRCRQPGAGPCCLGAGGSGPALPVRGGDRGVRAAAAATFGTDTPRRSRRRHVC